MNPDILKVIVILIALLYLNLKIKPYINPRNYWLMNVGLYLLLFAAALDFTDGIGSLNYFPILGREAPFHDVLEDQFGDTPGLALFMVGAFREVVKKVKGR